MEPRILRDVTPVLHVNEAGAIPAKIRRYEFAAEPQLKRVM